jgi:hypothetical protein
VNAVAEKLVKARKLVERGWTQGSYHTQCGRHSRYCAEGALAMSNGLCDAELFLRKAVGQFNIILWNDAPERTQAEVLAAFDKAIELAKARGND